MKLTFIGAAHEVTGSCTLLEACGKRIVIDCGMEQGADTYVNYDIPVTPGSIDAVCLTHAHIDHSGNIPTLTARGFKGDIYSTEATYNLCGIMFRDSAHIQESEAEWRNRKGARSGAEPYVPLYTMADAERTLKMFKPFPYGKTAHICDGISVTFSDAGHLLGSSSLLLEVTEEGVTKRILFSGDLGNVRRPLIRDPQSPPDADYVIIESTYGDRLHGERPDYLGQLTRIIQETLDRGGNVVIPAFAVGRTQELLYLIRTIKSEGLVRNHGDFPVYVDSPLAVEATNIYSNTAGLMAYYDEETLSIVEKGENPLTFKGLSLSITADDSKAVNFNATPKVIISASGMCEAGRIRHHLKHNLWRPECTVLFVGYQSEGTLGRKLINGEPYVRLFGEEIASKAHIETLAGISGHADRDMLSDWLGSMKTPPKKVFVNHGEDKVCEGFANLITNRFGIPAEAPYSGDEFDLVTGECIVRGEIVRVSKKKTADTTRRNSAAYDKLVAAGARLMGIIERYRHAAYKDMLNLADKINALCSQIENGKKSGKMKSKRRKKK